MLVLSMAVSAFACGDDGAEETVTPVEKVHYEGTHIFNQTDTGKYIVKDGVSDYKFVVTNYKNTYVDIGRKDLSLLFKKATGLELEVVVDKGDMEWNEDVKYISYGDTSLVAQAGITPEDYPYELLNDEGFRIITKGNTIFLLGANVLGINYSVYGLYEMLFNFEAYQRDCVYIDTNVSDVPLMNYDVTDVPDVKNGEIAERMDWHGADCNTANDIDVWYYGDTAQDEVTARGSRIRSGNYSCTSLTMPAHPNNDPMTGGYTMHNILSSYLNPESGYIDPLWKSDSGTQACFTAHGDAESLEAFVEHVFRIARDSILRYPTKSYPIYKVLQITCSDGTTTTCMCEACSKIAEANNGAYIASHIMFINKVNELLQPWVESLKDDPELNIYYRPQIEMQLFAYQITRQPPVYFDEETGEVTPCTDEVICQKGTNIFFVSGAGYYSIYDEVYRDTTYDWLRAWDVLTPESGHWFWTNAGNHATTTFYDELAGFDNDFYEVFAYYDVEELYQANHWSFSTTTSFMDLQFYVNKKIRWDCHLNMNELIKDYMIHMYGDAAGIMTELYEKLKVHWYAIKALLESRDKFTASNTYTKELWPVDFNQWWYSEVERAVAEVEKNPLDDANQQAVLVHRIRIEAIAPLANLIDLHGKGNQRELTDAQLVEYKKALYEIVKHHPYMSMGYSVVSGTVLERTII